MLETLCDVMKTAQERKIAIGSFNVISFETMRAVIDAAESLNLPVIIQFAQCHEALIPLPMIGPAMVAAAKAAKVPVCVHLDHGETLEYLEKALEIGFTAVMYDGSTLPYAENLQNTKETVEMARRTGASVEAELGSMGRRESGADDHTGAEDETKIYTDPILAAQFVKESGIDALACSFGTTHGIYLSKPKLNLDIVREVCKLTGDIPVVMHGGSGVSAEDYQKSIEAGVRKINYFTYMDKAGGAAIKEYVDSVELGAPLFYSAASTAARTAMTQDVKEAMKRFARM